MNNVFKCPCCFSSYSKDIHLPISLECGDVFCLPCIRSLISSSKEITCPIDGKHLLINLNSLITCKAILDFLPNKPTSNDLFYCKSHPEKKIKYSCDTDNAAFCSLCFVNHKKHQINTFYPSRQSISDQMQTILKATEDKKKALMQDKDQFNKSRVMLNQRLKEQIDYVKNSTEKIIKEIMQQSNEFQSALKEKYISQINTMDQFINENTKYKQFIVTIENDIQSCLNIVRSQSTVIYDDISDSKRSIVKKWEDFLLHYNITKIDINKHQMIEEEKVMIDFRYITNGNKKVFSCKTLSINDSDKNKENNNDNKENTPMKTRQFTKIFQMSAKSTNVNTNNFSLNNQTPKDILVKQKMIVFNPKIISNLNSL